MRDDESDRTFIEQVVAEEALVLGLGPYRVRWQSGASRSEELVIRGAHGDVVVPFRPLETEGIANKLESHDVIRSRIAIGLIGLRVPRRC